MRASKLFPLQAEQVQVALPLPPFPPVGQPPPAAGGAPAGGAAETAADGDGAADEPKKKKRKKKDEEPEDTWKVRCACPSHAPIFF